MLSLINIMNLFIFFFILISPSYGINIAQNFIKDQVFKKFFIKQYGEVIYNKCHQQVSSWIKLQGNNALTIQDLDILFNMYIPEKKKIIT